MTSSADGFAADSPRAQRSTQRSWRDPRLAVGVVLVAASMLGGAKILGDAEDTVRVWAAASDLPAGASVTADDLVAQPVRFDGSADADRYLSAAAPVESLTMLRGVGTGELLPRAAVSTKPPAPVLEVPISVDVDAVPVTVAVGSVVDVWVTPRRDGAAQDGAAVRAFDDVLVLAAPSRETTLGPAATRQLIIGVETDGDDQLAAALARVATGDAIVTREG